MTLGDLAKQYRMIYLATPYTKYPGGIEAAFEDTAALAGDLLHRGIPVFSPIVHSHPIAAFGGHDPVDHELWVNFDAVMLQKADAILVAMMPTWRDSRGIRHEIAEARRTGKMIFYLDPDTFEVD